MSNIPSYEQMTENERLKIIIHQSPYKTQKEFSERIGMQSGSISDVLRAKNGLGVSNMLKQKLERFLNVNLNWLETGKGDLFNNGYNSSDYNGGVPLYATNLDDQTEGKNFLEAMPEYFVDFKPFNDCTAYLPVFGDSMYPKYASGEIIAVKKILNHDIIQWGEAYVVITDLDTNNLKMLKVLHEHSDPTKLILKSTNPNYKGETVLRKKNILALYIIKGKITRNLI